MTDRTRMRGMTVGIVLVFGVVIGPMIGPMIGTMGGPALGFGPQALAAGVDGHPLAAEAPVLPLEEVRSYRAPAFDRAALAAEDLEREAEGLPYRFAVADYVTISPENAGTWETLADGRRLWRQRIACPGAVSLNLGFTQYALPPTARLQIYAADGTGTVLVFDVDDNKSHGELWTPPLDTDDLVIELVVDAGREQEVDLLLEAVNRGYRELTADDPEKSDDCEVDVACPVGDPWRDEIASVAVYTVAGTWKCTGSMINNTEQDGRPLFLTAYHCGIGGLNAAEVVVFWNYQSPECGMQGGGSLAQFQSGSTLVAQFSASDFTLLELDDVPDPEYGVKYAGWNRSTADPDSAVCIHHPATDEKSISVDRDPSTTASWGFDAAPGDGTHIRVADWDVGTTEGGSSGSPLFDPDHYIVGQLHGGDAACGNDLPDWFGRLSYSWDGGGSSETRLSDHLDPAGSGAVTLGLFDPLGFVMTVGGLDDWFPSGPAGGPFVPAEHEVKVRNGTDGNYALEVTTTSPWLHVTDGDQEVPAGSEITFTLSLDESVRDLPPGDYEAPVTLRETSEGDARFYTVILRVGGTPQLRIQSAAPNPFSSYVEVEYTLNTAALCRVRFFDVKGRLVRDFGTLQGYRGSNTVAWNGQSAGGGRLAAGAYYCHMESGGQEVVRGVLLLR